MSEEVLVEKSTVMICTPIEQQVDAAPVEPVPEPKSYFTVEELCRSQTAKARKIDNTPNEAQKKNLQNLIDKLLNPLREAIGHPIVITSGFRCKALNAAVGGVSRSAHLEGLAVDMKCPGYKNGDVKEFCKFVANWLKENNIPFDQCIYERPKGVWVHLGIRHLDGKQRKQVFTIAPGGRTLQGIV